MGTYFWTPVSRFLHTAVINITVEQAFECTGRPMCSSFRILLTVAGPLSCAYTFYPKLVGLYQKHPVEIVIEVVGSLLGSGIRR